MKGNNGVVRVAMQCAGVAQVATEAGAQRDSAVQMNTISHLSSFPVVEFRRYTIKKGNREKFVKYFETYFPEAFEQLGALALAQFRERGSDFRFIWLRGFHNMNDRPIINSAFYFGPLWREHGLTMNALMADSDNVLLLRPLLPETEVTVLPAVDPVTEERGATGIVIAQIFALKSQPDEASSAKLRSALAAGGKSGMREVGLLVTLDKLNNFPQLPVRTDGPFLIWLGMVKDEENLAAALKAIHRGGEELAAQGFLRESPEVIVLEPTPRSRLRWLPGWN
jgi:hypothetical protein